MDFKNEFPVYCVDCKTYKRSFKQCFDKRHCLVSNDAEYDDETRNLIKDVLINRNKFVDLQTKYKFNDNLDTMIFILRYIEPGFVPTRNIEPENGYYTEFTNLCPIHHEEPHGFCLTCNRNFCFHENLHFDHKYILYADTNISREYDFSSDTLSKVNEYIALVESLKVINNNKDFNINTHNEIINMLASSLVRADSFTLKNGIVEALNVFNVDTNKLIEKDVDEVKAGIEPLVKYAVDMNTPLDILTYKMLFKEIPLNTRLLLNEYHRLKICISCNYNILYYNFYKGNMYLRVFNKDTKVQSYLYYNLYNHGFGFKKISIDKDKKFILSRHIRTTTNEKIGSYKISVIYSKGSEVSFTTKNILEVMFNKSLHISDFTTTHKLSTSHVNTYIDKANYFYFISDDGLIRVDMFELYINEKTCVYINEEKHNIDNTVEDVIPTPTKPKRLLTLYNTKIDLMYVDENNDIYYFIDEYDDFDTHTLTWNKLDVITFAKYDTKLRFYVGSWLDETPEAGMLSSKYALYTYNSGTIKLKNNFITVPCKFAIAYSLNSNVQIKPLLF